MSSIAISSQAKGIQLPAHGRGAAFLFGSRTLRLSSGIVCQAERKSLGQNRFKGPRAWPVRSQWVSARRLLRSEPTRRFALRDVSPTRTGDFVVIASCRAPVFTVSGT